MHFSLALPLSLLVSTSFTLAAPTPFPTRLDDLTLSPRADDSLPAMSDPGSGETIPFETAKVVVSGKSKRADDSIPAMSDVATGDPVPFDAAKVVVPVKKEKRADDSIPAMSDAGTGETVPFEATKVVVPERKE